LPQGASPDWFSVPNNIVWIANGRVNAQSFALDNLNSNNPRLYAVDLPLSNTTSPITNLVIEWVSGNGSGHSAIMAISGQASGGGNFTPIAGTGYNADIVVEASAPQSQPLTGTTTVTMDAGLGNADATWYERGYSMAAPATGLPAAGSTLSSNISGVTYSFVLPASYAANNAIFLDAGSSNATLTLATPAALGGLSFLTAAGNGPGEISAVIHHQDGSTEPAQFSSPDWFGGTPFAYVANGRVSVSSGVLDSLNSGNPRLYAVNVVVTNTTSPTTSIDLTYTSTDGRAVIFALAGTTGAVAPMLITQPNSATASEGQDISFSGVASGTAPITYQWQIGFNGVFTNVANAGNVSGATTT
jgi:hypothetical protein